MAFASGYPTHKKSCVRVRSGVSFLMSYLGGLAQACARSLLKEDAARDAVAKLSTSMRNEDR